MKKYVLIVIGLFLASAGWAQTEKSNGIISGTVSVDYSKANNSNRSIAPGLNLTAGHFFANNWLMGLSTTVNTTFLKTKPAGLPGEPFINNSTVRSSITPFVRRYWRFDPVHFFAGAGLTIGVTGSRQTDLVSNDGQPVFVQQRLTGVSVDPYFEGGLNYLLTNRLGLQLVASTTSIPFRVAGVNVGLVYWTGPGRRASVPREQANPQTDKGRWLLEGSFSVSSQTTKQDQTSPRTSVRLANTTYALNPSVGFFVKKNSLLGISVPVSIGTYKTEPGGQSVTNWNIGISPYYQRYWSSTRLTPYTRVSANYTLVSFTTIDEKVNNFGAGLNLGLAYMAGQRFIVETSLANVSFNYMKGGPINDAWSANITAELTGNFAVRYAFK
ncbi:hypothetical protein GCM10027341_14480 [Spirosoma knui]